MQARMSKDDPRFYNVNRDIAHCFADVSREVAARLEDERWPALKAYLDGHEVNMDDLGTACKAFIEFVAGACDDPKEKLGDVLARVGWWGAPEPAQIALLSIVGTVMMGYFFNGAREATLGGVGPCSSLEDLRISGREAYQALMAKSREVAEAEEIRNAPFWKRWWVRRKIRHGNSSN